MNAMKYMKIFAIAAALCAVTACDDDEIKISSYLPEPASSELSVTVSSLSLSWEAVQGATQYGWQLLSSEGENLRGDVTTSTSVLLKDLTPDTEYVFEVWAYAPVYGSVGNSKILSQRVRTAAQVVLGTPVVQYELDGDAAVVSWEPVENAASYSVTVTSADGLVNKTSTTEDTSTKVSKLTSEVEYTVRVKALSGEEKYLDSESTSVNFTYIFIPPTFTLTIDDLVGEYTCTTSGTQYVEDESGEFGWDYDAIEITRVEGSEDQLIFDGFYWNGYYPMVGTVDFNTMTITFEPQEFGYYIFAGDESETTPVVGTIAEDKTITISGWNAWYSGWTYFENTVNVYTKNAPAGPTIDDFVGEYTYNTTGQYYNDSYEWEEFAYTDVVNITKVEGSENQLVFDGFYWTDCTVVGTVDFQAKTITFEPQAWGSYGYYFAGDTNASTPVVATFDDNFNVTVSQWNGWYYFEGDDWYSYFYNTSTIYTKN